MDMKEMNYSKKVKEICKNSRGRLKASPKEIVEALDADMESKVWFSIRKIIEHIRYLDKELEEHLDKLREETIRRTNITDHCHKVN